MIFQIKGIKGIWDMNKISAVKALLYDCPNNDIQKIISQIEDVEVLYLYAYNYNWDNGFEIIHSILSGKYQRGEIWFQVPLSKMQRFQIKRQSQKKNIFSFY